jgi:small subunit ribosomal protein S4e
MVVLLRDILGVANTLREVAYILYTSEILVNGKKATTAKTPCGLFDVVEFKATGEKFTLVLDESGKLKITPTKEDVLYLKVTGKTVAPGKRYQFNFMNGFNLFVDAKTFNDVEVGSTVLFNFVQKKIVGLLPLKEGAAIYVFDGKYQGTRGIVKSFVAYNGLAKDRVVYSTDKEELTTAKNYAFVIGTKKEDLKKFN